MIICPKRSVSMRPSILANSRSASNSAHRRRLKPRCFSWTGNSSVNIAMPLLYWIWLARSICGPAKKLLSLQPAMWYPALQTFRMRMSVMHAQN